MVQTKKDKKREAERQQKIKTQQARVERYRKPGETPIAHRERLGVKEPQRLTISPGVAKEAGVKIGPGGEVRPEDIKHVQEIMRERLEPAKPVGVQEAKETEARTLLEETGFFEEEVPVKTELDIPKLGEAAIIPEELPVVGPAAAALQTGIFGDIARILNEDKDVDWAMEAGKPPIQDPETLRELALWRIQKEEMDKGTSAAEKFGAVIEAIPVVGPLVGKYSSGLIESPRENVETLIGEIRSERERASVLAEKIATGKFGDPMEAYNQILGIEENIARCEARIKLLAIESAVLRADADAINKIEEEILRSKERVFMAKQSAAQGIMLGLKATDASLYLELQKLKGG